ncbi:MAG: hypothetical protein ACR2RF_06105 [Geminicoccaceae bacterium]
MSAEAIRAQMTEMVQEAAEPRPVGDSVKAAINRAALRLRKPPGWVKRHWYGEVSRVEAHEYVETRSRIERQRAKEITRLRAQIATLEVQQEADLDAMAAQLPILLGPLYPLACKMGLVNPEAVASQEDGKA